MERFPATKVHNKNNNNNDNRLRQQLQLLNSQARKNNYNIGLGKTRFLVISYSFVFGNDIRYARRVAAELDWYNGGLQKL